MTKKSKMILALASMLGVSAGATAISGFAWFTTTKSADIDISNIGVYSKSSALSVTLGSAVKGCTDVVGEGASKEGDINLVGAVASENVTDYVTATANQTVFTLDQYPSAEPTVKVNNVAYSGTITWEERTKTVTLDQQAEGAVVSFTYAPYAALTDVSSVDGINVYKPVWTASGEGKLATAITANPSTGYIQFTMNLKATGSAELNVFLDRPSIDPIDSGATSPDTYAANLTRVAFVENNTTKLILQKDPTTNNKGIDSTFAGTANCRLDGTTATPNDGWDLSQLTATVSSDVLAGLDNTNKAVRSSAPAFSTAAEKKASNFITTVPAGQSTTITVTIWLEGTSGNTDGKPEGSFVNSPENGMIDVNLPLIAF